MGEEANLLYKKRPQKGTSNRGAYLRYFGRN
jgi:hypothetical protein